jgi:autotransporter translocation and assembly factor TamB
MARLGRLLAVGIATVAVIAGLLASGLWLASRTRVADDFVRAQVLGLLRRSLPGAEVSIARTDGLLGRRLVLYDLDVRVGGRRIAHVPRVEILYRPLALLRSVIRLDRVTVVAPSLRAIHEDGAWRLPHLVQGSGGGALAVELRRVEVSDGRLAVALLDASPRRRLAATALHVEGSARLDAAGRDLRVSALRFVPRGVGVTPVEGEGRFRQSADGALELVGGRIATARSHLTASGRVVPGASVETTLDLAPLAARELRALVPATRLVRDVTATLGAAGPWRAVGVRVDTRLGEAGSAEGRGTLDLTATPPRYSASLGFSALDPGAAVSGLPRAKASGRARARGQGLGRLAPVSYHLALGPSVIAERPLAQLVVAGRATNGVHDLAARGTAPIGEASLRARLDLAEPLTYRIESRLHVKHMEVITSRLPGWAAGRVDVRGAGTAPESRHATLHATLAGASLRGIALSRGTLDAQLDGPRLAIGRAAVAGARFDAGAHGTADLARRSVDLALEGTGDLAAIAPSLAGSLGVRATARGGLDALAVDLDARARQPGLTSVKADEAHATLSLTGLGGASPMGTLRLDAARVRVRDSAPRQLGARVDWRRAGDVDRASLSATATSFEAASDGVEVTLERSATAIRGQLASLVLTPPGGPTWRLVRPAQLTLADGIATPALTLAAGEQQLAVAGRVAWRGANDATVTLTKIALAPICRLAEPLGCAGQLSGRVALGGTASAPRIDATLQAGDVRVDEVRYGAVEATLAYADARATVRAVLQHPEAGTLRLDGAVPVDLAWSGPRRDLAQAPLSLEVVARGLDLTFVRSLAPHALRSTAGRLDLHLKVSGSRAAPLVAGDLALDGGRLELAAAGIAYEDVRVRATAEGTHVAVTEIHARAGDGTLAGGGTLDVGGAKPIAVTARLEKFFAVRRPAYEIVVSGDVALGGTVASPEVRASLDVEHALVRPAVLPTTAPGTEPDSTITVVGGPPGPPPPPEAPGAPLGDRLRLVADVRITHDAWIRRVDASIELGGELHIEKRPYEPLQLAGRIRLVHGWYVFQGRRFTLDPGSTITFTGPTPPKPVLSVTAVYSVPAYRIEVHVTGSAEKPTLTLSSEPPMEQADILSVLLFGKPTDDLGRGQSAGLQGQAVQLAAAYAVPELRESVMNTLGIDTLSVELPQGSEAPGRVALGRYVNGDIFVSLAQEFGARAGGVVSLEYSLTPRISVRGSTSTRGSSAIDTFWHRRY